MISDTEFEQLIEKYNYSYKPKEIVKGKVVGYEGNYVLVDINAKTNAKCPINEVLMSKEQDIKDILKLNEEYDFVINSFEDEDGVFYLSHRKVMLSHNLEVLEEKFKNDEIVTGSIISVVKGGVCVNVMGVKGFIPSSQLKIEEAKIGQELELKILALDMNKNNFVLSNKKVYQESIENVKKEILEKIEPNMVVKGRVVRITDFGAFVDIGGLDALLPLSQISWSWIDNPNDALKLDEKIDVEIIGIDKEKQRVSLSLKSLEKNPWLEAKDVLEIDKTIKGKVTRVKSFGAFVEVYPKVEGLLSKYQLQEYKKKNNKDLNEQDEIDVVIKKLDIDNQKINLDFA